jgi:hypothetical protein
VVPSIRTVPRRKAKSTDIFFFVFKKGGVSEAEQSPVYCKAFGVAKSKQYIGGGEKQNKIYMYIILISDKV